MSIRSGDIRDQSLKLSEIAPISAPAYFEGLKVQAPKMCNFLIFAVPFFSGDPNFVT